MDLSQMRRFCGWHCFLLGKAELRDYEIVVDKRGFVSILFKPGEKVMGILYDINQESLNILDEFEGYPQIFNRKYVKITDDEGKIFTACVYLEPEDQCGGNINENHWKMILNAARDNKMPDFWIKKLENLSSTFRKNPIA